PLRKLVAKERQGAKLIKRYDQPMTPYQRLLASGVLDDATRQALEKQFISLNPADLQRRIDLALRRLWSTAPHQRQNARKAG
ncbi:MAG TPA: integrase, partial [Dehalococcoidia bacterium]|nr:integrase [Dehalococcoidia bacterium]